MKEFSITNHKREKDSLEDLVTDGKIILKWILNIRDMNTWSGLMWLRIEKYGGCCEHGNEHSGFVKHRKFLDQLGNFTYFKDGRAHVVSVLWYDALLFGWPPIIWRQQVAPKRLTELRGSQQQIIFVLCITFRLLRSLPSAPTAHCMTPDKQL